MSPARITVKNKALNLFFSLRLISASLRKCQDERLAKINLSSPQYAVMLVIKSMKPPVTQKDLAIHFDQSVNSISLIIERMRKNGFLETHKDLPDRRAIRLVLTVKAKKLLAKAHRMAIKLIEEIIGCLTDEEIFKLQETLEKIRNETYLHRTLNVKVKAIYMDDVK